MSIYLRNHLEEEERWLLFFSLSFGYLVTVNVLWLFLMVLWVVLHCVIVLFPDKTYLLFVTIMQ